MIFVGDVVGEVVGKVVCKLGCVILMGRSRVMKLRVD